MILHETFKNKHFNSMFWNKGVYNHQRLCHNLEKIIRLQNKASSSPELNSCENLYKIQINIKYKKLQRQYFIPKQT